MGSYPDVIIRPGRLADAAGMAAVLNATIAERRYTAMDGQWSVGAEEAYIAGLGPRAILMVAEVAEEIVGFQDVEPFAAYTPALDHVGVMGTMVAAPWRGQGIGRQLSTATLAQAVALGFEKLVVYVRASNQEALGFYRSLSFQTRGTLRRQVKIDGVYDDQVVMERFLGEDGGA
jgi:L-amino acid N-acyltransferase YncA